ncbi:MAG: hypothetical protein EBU12_10220 [Microbacteriaceae bacterium]|nr:hypothetical protein [Microbacteriaceae bacterium]
MGDIYKLYFDNIDKEVYIGQTKRKAQRRFMEHRCKAKNNKTLLEKWINNNGRFNLKYSILYQGDDLDFNEIKFIKYYKKKGFKLYNITNGGSGEGATGYKHTEQEKKRRSLKNWSRDYSIYTFNNRNGDSFTGNRLDFSKYSGINPSVVCQLIRHIKKTRNGWYEINCKDIMGNNKPRNNNKYKFRHILHGNEECTCWDLIQKYSLDNSKIYQVVKGKRNQHKGWFLNYT